MSENLPTLISSEPCPCCLMYLHWSASEQPPQVAYDPSSGLVLYVELVRYCISCGYQQAGYLKIDKEPTWIVKEQ